MEWALDVCGFRDTAAGRRRFDEFVMEVALDDLPWISHDPDPRDRCLDLPGDPAGLHELIRVGRELGNMGPAEPIDSRTRAVVRVRVAIAHVATRDLGIRHVDVARRLGVTAGALSNALAHFRDDDEVCALTDRLRERWGSENTTS
ncbi:MAG: hypothetical protein H6719_25645 [Sandaracinaceae bacterium]|nr:hypothetical protein [Sandaracinaceae bacterium]